MEEYEDLEFIWGVKSWDDLSGREANINTMNDIDIIYDKSKNQYMLGVELIYDFKNIADKIEYLEKLLELFTEYMKKNNYNMFEDIPLMCLCNTSFLQDSIEDLYTSFYIYVNGVCKYLRMCEA